jgi:hypothetical protein
LEAAAERETELEAAEEAEATAEEETDEMTEATELDAFAMAEEALVTGPLMLTIGVVVAEALDIVLESSTL